MIAHLVAGGRRRIVHVAGPEGNVDARERVGGYRAAMARHAPGVEPVILAGDFSEEAGEAAARTIRDNAIPCDAVFAANDMMAIGCLQALRNAGVAVPGEIAVAGFDDVPLARYLDLTTVRVRIAEMGARAIERLIDVLEGGPADDRAERHAAELVVRGTTAARE
jgi:LacI family transcriptional regulator